MENFADHVLLPRGRVPALEDRVPLVFGRSSKQPEEWDLKRVDRITDIVSSVQQQGRNTYPRKTRISSQGVS